jgi:hypothetical protein
MGGLDMAISKQNALATPEYESMEEERKAESLARRSMKSPRIKVLNGRVVMDHPDKFVAAALMADAIGSDNIDFLNGFIRQLDGASSKGSEADENALNFMLSVVKGIEPRDQIEAMLAAQMAAVHTAVMVLTGKLFNAPNIQQRESTERSINRLMRTFAAQMETLKRYRTAEYKMTIQQQVNVGDGGRAIVTS